MFSLFPSLNRALANRSSLVTRLAVHQTRFTSTLKGKCPSCSSPFPSHLPVCNSCWSIHPLPHRTTYHHLLNVPYEPNPFAIDLKELKSHFLQAQALCHPDTWASKSEEFIDDAHSLSSLLNEAYICLSEPLSRAEYILGYNGVELSESDKLEDGEFVMEIMDARETIDNAQHKDKSEILSLHEENKVKTAHTLQQLESLIKDRDWIQAKTAIMKLQYRRGIERAINDWLFAHG